MASKAEEIARKKAEEEARKTEEAKLKALEERKKLAEQEAMRKRAEEEARKKEMERHRLFASSFHQQLIKEKQFEEQMKKDKALFILYKSESEAQQKETVNKNIQIAMKTETTSIAKMTLCSDINSIFGDISMPHDELQKLSQKFYLLHIETKKRALHEIVKCIKMATFMAIWNAWCGSTDCNEYSLIKIAFKYYEYVGMLCCWKKEEEYMGKYDEYTRHSLWCIHSDGKMYEKINDDNSIREDIKYLKMSKQIETKQVELLISYLICYPLGHIKNMYTFKNYGRQIAEWYGLNIDDYKYDRYEMGKELFLFFKNELEIDFPNNFV